MIAAPPEKVYAAFIDPEALLAWLPASGMTGKFERFDLRPGGSYRTVLTYGDAPVSGGKATADSDIPLNSLQIVRSAIGSHAPQRLGR
jgi:uncharacterized protein YndB with AHSA1/START domain